MVTCRAHGPFRIVRRSAGGGEQNPDIVSEHTTPAEAYREIDRLSADSPDVDASEEWIVLDADGVVVPRFAVQ